MWPYISCVWHKQMRITEHSSGWSQENSSHYSYVLYSRNLTEASSGCCIRCCPVSPRSCYGADLNIILLYCVWRLIGCQGVASNSVLFGHFFYKSCCCLSDRGFKFGFFFIYTAVGSLSPSSDCIILSVLSCERIERSYFKTRDCFIFHRWWEASLCPSEGELGSFKLSGIGSVCWWLQWVSRFSSPLSLPSCIPAHYLAHCCPSIPSLNTFPGPLRMRVIMLLFGFDLVQCCP